MRRIGGDTPYEPRRTCFQTAEKAVSACAGMTFLKTCSLSACTPLGHKRGRTGGFPPLRPLLQKRHKSSSANRHPLSSPPPRFGAGEGVWCAAGLAVSETSFTRRRERPFGFWFDRNCV
ncbi:hypothetical protein HMPREF9120_00818 [Neisseria sp. oral taxon 020 str. F0370]|nr:hypothetical protein HMPREF9120_00818 [Neisseria sp. oral taxon 020 str. F0370]